MRLFKQLFDFDRPETPGEVLFFKLFELFIVYATLNLAWQWGFYTLRISDIVLPLGMARYVDVSFMFGDVLPLVNAALITILAVLGFFRVGRFAYLAAFLLLHLQYAARFSLGEIPHSANMLGMTLLGLALAMAAFDEARPRRRFTMGFTYFFVGLGYTLAAFCKLIATGPSWADGSHLWMWVFEKGVDAYAKTGVFGFNFLQELILGSHLLATVFLTIGLVTEFFAFLMWWPRFRTPVVLGVIALHVGIYVVMNILFIFSMYELIFLAFPWAVWIDRALRHATVRALLRPLQGLSLRFA